MPDRENVIEGLERILHSGKMYDAHLVIDTCEAAIILPKAQEPRVMTLEEVKELHPDDDVYIERISSITGVHYIYAMTVWRVVSKSIKFCPDNATLWFSEYGETWRCWTSRPTDEQREATPWSSV